MAGGCVVVVRLVRLRGALRCFVCLCWLLALFVGSWCCVWERGGEERGGEERGVGLLGAFVVVVCVWCALSLLSVVGFVVCGG